MSNISKKKGLKINEAVLIDSGKKVAVKDFDEKDRDNIKCPSCSAKLSYTKGHYRNKNKDNRTWVRSFFRLQQGQEHESSCINSIDNAIEIVVRNSRNVAGMDEDVLLKEGASFQFRLHILDEEIKKVKNDTVEENDIEELNIAVSPKQSRKSLKPYLTTAKELVKLWSVINDSADKAVLQDKIHLKYKSKKIAWSSFVYETNQLHKLIGKQIYYPIALIIEVKECESINISRINKYSVQAYSCVKDNNVIVPRVYCNQESINNKFENDFQYLVVGQASICPETRGDTIFYNLNIFLKDSSQVVKLSEEKVKEN